MYVLSNSSRLGILPSVNVRSPHLIVPARLALSRLRHPRRRGSLGAMVERFNGDGARRPCPAWGCRGPVLAPPQPSPATMPATMVATPNFGTPVPAGFSRNQLFVAADGSQWIYSAPQGTWVSVGTPYNVNAPSASAPPSSSKTSTSSDGVPASSPIAAPAPSAVPGESTYGPILQWLTQSSLIAPLPNWAVALAAALALKAVPALAQGGRR